jgi:hypothetical protein
LDKNIPKACAVPGIGGGLVHRYVIIALIVVAAGCAPREVTTELQVQIKEVREQISNTKADRDRYGDGSVLHSLISLRLAMQEQTLAMLEQKKAAMRWFPWFSYTVDGKPYQPPADAADKVKTLESQIEKAQAELTEQRARVTVAGGLIGVLAALTAELKAFELAQLEYELAAYRNGFPHYVGSFRAAAADIRNDVRQTTTKPSEARQKELKSKVGDVEDAMNAALQVQLVKKKFYPQSVEARRYQNTLQLEFEYANRTEKEIRAFTGTVVFMDIFDRPFKRVRLTVDTRIPAGKKVADHNKSLDINQFDSSDQQLVSTETENLHFKFEPQAIRFSDGTTLGSTN